MERPLWGSCVSSAEFLAGGFWDCCWSAGQQLGRWVSCVAEESKNMLDSPRARICWILHDGWLWWAPKSNGVYFTSPFQIIYKFLFLSTPTQTRTWQNVLKNAAPSLGKVVNLQCSVVFTQKLWGSKNTECWPTGRKGMHSIYEEAEVHVPKERWQEWLVLRP